MDTPRRTFLQLVAAGAATVPFLDASPANPAANASRPRDSRLMGEAKFVDVNGIRTRYFDGGNGEPLVLVHGAQWPSTASARARYGRCRLRDGPRGTSRSAEASCTSANSSQSPAMRA